MEMQYTGHVGARAVLAFVVALALIAVRHRKLRGAASWVHGAAAILAAAAFFNFGPPFHAWNPGFADLWENFHYQLGAKYFEELGYDGLYVASMRAQRESDPERAGGPVRDLRTNKVDRAADLAPHAREVRARFSDERWASFVADHRYYQENFNPDFWVLARRDHGYNPSPAWTFTAQRVGANLKTSSASLLYLASLDVLLLIAMFAVVARTFGGRAACLSIAIAGLGYGWRHMYIGDFLRLDWLATSVIGICMLKRERYASAGACFAYATMARIFPVLLLTGPFVLALKGWREERRPPRWTLRLAAGFTAVACAALLAGSLTGRGPGAWTEFADNIRLHTDTWSTSLWGVESVVLRGPAYLYANLHAPVERDTHASARKRLEERQPIRLALAAAMMTLLALAAWNATLSEAAVLGLVAIFALTPAANYYWIVAAILPFHRSVGAPAAFLLLAAAANLLTLSYSDAAYDPFRNAFMAWGLGIFLVAWLLPDALRTLRGETATTPGETQPTTGPS